MSTQLSDGTWTDVEPIAEALDTLMDRIGEGTARRFVCGTEEEVRNERERVKLEADVSEMADRIKRLEARSDQSMVAVPTQAEVLRFGGSS